MVRCVLGDQQPGRLQEGGGNDGSSGGGALGVTRPATGDEQASVLLPSGIASAAQEFCRRFVGVLVDRMNFVAGLKVGYVVA